MRQDVSHIVKCLVRCMLFTPLFNGCSTGDEPSPTLDHVLLIMTLEDSGFAAMSHHAPNGHAAAFLSDPNTGYHILRPFELSVQGTTLIMPYPNSYPYQYEGNIQYPNDLTSLEMVYDGKSFNLPVPHEPGFSRHDGDSVTDGDTVWVQFDTTAGNKDVGNISETRKIWVSPNLCGILINEDVAPGPFHISVSMIGRTQTRIREDVPELGFDTWLWRRLLLFKR